MRGGGRGQDGWRKNGRGGWRGKVWGRGKRIGEGGVGAWMGGWERKWAGGTGNQWAGWGRGERDSGCGRAWARGGGGRAEIKSGQKSTQCRRAPRAPGENGGGGWRWGGLTRWVSREIGGGATHKGGRGPTCLAVCVRDRIGPDGTQTVGSGLIEGGSCPPSRRSGRHGTGARGNRRAQRGPIGTGWYATRR